MKKFYKHYFIVMAVILAFLIMAQAQPSKDIKEDLRNNIIDLSTWEKPITLKELTNQEILNLKNGPITEEYAREIVGD